ncbi:hypothetical protein [Actinopolymorpha alba]|uniref:hypothetical protein n=1 Tax=Actinopolymorpha alba TaxID=533267 RepID=UPI0003AAA8F6|nr:hypothetical protein [Actinopolymorpha alba]
MVTPIGRRTFLQLSGVGAVAVLGSGFFTARPATASSGTPGEQWEFDSQQGWFVQPIRTTGTAITWEFNTNDDAEGWTAANGLGPFSVAGGTLSTRVTGFDPYMVAPSVNLSGIRDRILRIRMRATAGEAVAIYFATDESPALAEDKRIKIPINADGAFHEYVVDLGAANALWRQGTVRVFRLDREPATADGAEIEIDYIRIEQLDDARVAVTPLSVSPGSVRAGKDLTLTVKLANLGGRATDPFPTRLTLSEGFVLTSGDPERTVPALSPGAEVTLSWAAKPNGDVPGVASIDLVAPGAGQRFGVILPAVPRVVKPGTWSPEGVRAFRDSAGHVYLQNAKVRMILARGASGYAQLILDVRSGNRWQQVATAQPLTWLLVPASDGVQLLPVVPTQVRLSTAGIVLTGTVTDASGVQWSVELTFSLRAGANSIRAEYAATPDRDAGLFAFRGPSLTAGEGSFGGTQDAALFPGLEWLVAGEKSSSTLDANPPINLRTTPHPLKVTVPLMAIASGDKLVSVQWDANQAWNGAQQYPSARFASPNWLDGQDNHLLSLFVPSTADAVAENAPWATAAYAASAGRRLTVTADLVAEDTGDILRALDRWYDAYGLPEPAEKPFSWADELALVRHAYVNSYWVPEAKGWQHVYGWEPKQFVPYAAVLQLAGLLADAPEDRDAALGRVREFVTSVLANSGPGGLASTDGAGIAMYHAPFYLGHLEGALPKWQASTADLINAQKPDGGWPFMPDAAREFLGKPGTEIMGLSAVNTHLLLRYARLTGNSNALAAGLRGIGFLDELQVPRAAQSWEVPIHTPDVLASAYGVGAYAEAYRLTGKRKHLERAVYWARTGLPFLYSSTDPERPLLPYASIPVFGTSNFALPWFGVPVQWNGLVYAYFLLDLIDAATDPTGRKPFDLSGRSLEFAWRKVAEGIVVSALHQQRQQEPGKGGYPDNWPLIPNVPVPNVDINPETIAKPAIMLIGHPVDVQTTLLGGRIRLSTAADVLAATRSSSSLTAQLGFYEGQTSQLLVAGTPPPRSVTVDRRPLVAISDLDGAAEGWKRLDDGMLIVKLRHAQTSTLTLSY